MRAAVVAALAVAACGSSKKAPVSDAGPAIALTVDGAEVAHVHALDLRGRVSLASLLPEASRTGWRAVHARAGKRTLDLAPFTPYEGLEVVLEATGGDVTLAVYRPVPPGASAAVAAELAKPRVSMDGIEAIDVVRTAETTEPVAALAPITVTIGATSRSLDAADLDAIPHADSKGGKQQGWKLGDVLASVAPGPYAEVSITGDITVALDAARLRDELAVVRPNKKGMLVLDVFRGDERVDHVRDIVTINATTEAP